MTRRQQEPSLPHRPWFAVRPCWLLLLVLFAETSDTVHSYTPKTHKILLLGDSWAEHAGQENGQLLKDACNDDEYEGTITVVNAADSGRTSLEWFPALGNTDLKQYLQKNTDADAVWISLGGNDMMRSNVDCYQLKTELIGARVWDIVMEVHDQIPRARILMTGYSLSPTCTTALQSGACVLDHLVEFNSYLAALVADYKYINRRDKSEDDTLFIADAMMQLDTGSDEPDRLWDWDCVHLRPDGYRKLFEEPVIKQALCPKVEPKK